LLGLESINASKTENLSEQERAQAFLAGTKFIEKAFNANQKSAAAANALCELFLRKGSYKRVCDSYWPFENALDITSLGFEACGAHHSVR
jgi:hypothetical protein